MIDLSQLPAPALLEDLDFEAIHAGKVERFQSLYPQYSAALESDPVIKLLELSAYDEVMYRARVNDAAKAVMLAYATGADLDHLAALFKVPRLTVTEADETADPPVEAVYESDERLRYRVQMALEGMTVAGSSGAYIFHALAASAAVADVSVDAPRFARVDVPAAVAAQLPVGAIVLQVIHAAGLAEPMPGDVVLNVLATQHADPVYAELLPAVETYLSADTRRPLTDHPHAVAAVGVPFRVAGTIEFEPGPDPSVAYELARKQLDATLAASRRLGGDVPRSAIYSALHTAGVKRVNLVEPVDDVMCGVHEFPVCESIDLPRPT